MLEQDKAVIAQFLRVWTNSSTQHTVYHKETIVQQYVKKQRHIFSKLLKTWNAQSNKKTHIDSCIYVLYYLHL